MSKSDEEIARRAVQMQERAKDYSLFELPGYSEWASRKLDSGESPATLAHLESIGTWMLPEEAAVADEPLFEEMLAELKFSLGE